MTESMQKRRIAIACQGGGSHTAFTAGALNKILEKVKDKRQYKIVALSGTSGGAVCAFLAWYALLEENNETEAIEALRSFWQEDNSAHFKVGSAQAFLDVLTNDFMVGANQLRKAAEITLGMGFNAEFNPYRYHVLLDYWRERLKRSIEKNVREIDHDSKINHNAKEIDQSIEKRVNESDQDLKLFIGAVNTLTGEFQAFKSHKKDGARFTFNDSRENRVSVDAVLASAAIPVIFEATCTGEVVYWDPSRKHDQRSYLGEGVYWDGLYSQNPPVRDLTDADPHEIWVIQINPEEKTKEPKSTAEIEDRRNELSGNISLNQELYFVRKINELVKKCGHWEEDHDEITRKVYRVPQPDDEGEREKKYATIKVRRIELSIPLDDVSSKMNRSPRHIDKLMEHGVEQATHFLEIIPSQITFEEVWEKALKDKGKKNLEDRVNDVMSSFDEDLLIELVPPDGLSGELSHAKSWEIRDAVNWFLERNLTIEQSRDYQVREDGSGEKVVTCWILATAAGFEDPIKGRVEVVVRDGQITRLAFYPLSLKVLDKLQKAAEEELNRGAARG